MKKLITIIGILFFNLVISAQKSDDFTGKGKAPKGAIIIVTKSDEGFIGKTEIENAVGLKDVKFANSKWPVTILNPKENLIEKCGLILYPTKLKVIAKKGVFHRTLYWINNKNF